MSFLFDLLTSNNFLTLIVFVLIAASVLYFRKSFSLLGKVIFVYRTSKFNAFMAKLAVFKRTAAVYGLLASIAGIAAIIFMVYVSAIYFGTLIAAPKASQTAGVELILPVSGVPGVINIPIAYFLIALVIATTLHELSHGVLALSKKIRLKSAGFVLFLAFFPLGAFVEPNERDFNKSKRFDRIKVVAVGSFTNLLIGVAAFAVVMILANYMISTNLVNFSPLAYNIQAVENSSPAALAGIPANITISQINGNLFYSRQQIFTAINDTPTGAYLNLTTTNGTTYNVIPAYNATTHSKYIGVVGILTLTETPPIPPIVGALNPSMLTALPGDGLLGQSLYWLYGLLLWIVLINIGLGLINFLPVFYITDGCKMVEEFLGYIIKDKKRLLQAKNWIIVAFSALFIMLTPVGAYLISLI